MKNSLIIFSALISFISNSQTQIGNSDFEQWESSTSEIDEPVNWNSFKTATGTWSSFGGQQLEQSSNIRPGSSGMFSARIWSRDAGFGVIANGNLTLGRIEMGSTTASSSSNYNYSSTGDANFSEEFNDAPDSIVFWAKYSPITPTGNDARASVIIHNNTNNYKDPNDVAGASTIATAILNFPSNGGAWERISIPFTYVGTVSDAAYIIATFTTNKTPGGGSANDELLIDDVQLIYNPQGIGEIANSDVNIHSENGILTIKSLESINGTYSVFNTAGQAIQEGTIENELKFNAPTGVYFILLNSDKGQMTQRFIQH